MKLNKEVCKKCASNRQNDWGYIDGKWWERDLVMCYFDNMWKPILNSTNSIPEDCKYKLEHLVIK